MKRIKLAMARARKHWTLEKAAELLLVDVNTLSRWERGKATPRAYNIQRLCEVYETTAVDLGLQEEEPGAGAWPSSLVTPSEQEREETLQEQVTAILRQDVTVHLLKIVWTWSRRNTNYDELQRLIMQKTEDNDTVNQENTPSINRRDALRHLALLPLELCGLTALGLVLKSPVEEILTQCAAGITACLYLSKGQHEDMTLASSVISAYLPTLKTIVKDVPVYRKQAARLTAQSYLLKATLAVHSQGAKQAAQYGELAAIYSEESGDFPLRLVVLKRLAWMYACDKQMKQALEKVLQARQLLQQSAIPVAPVIQSSIYGGVAKYQAQNDPKGDGLTALQLAHQYEMLAATDSSDGWSSFSDHNYSTYLMDESLTYYYMRQYDQAFASLTQAIDPETLKAKIPISSERIRIEIINHQVLASLKSPKRDRELTIHLWRAGIQGARILQSEQRFQEASAAFEMMECLWPEDLRKMGLQDEMTRW